MKEEKKAIQGMTFIEPMLIGVTVKKSSLYLTAWKRFLSLWQ